MSWNRHHLGACSFPQWCYWFWLWQSLICREVKRLILVKNSRTRSHGWGRLTKSGNCFFPTRISKRYFLVNSNLLFVSKPQEDEISQSVLGLWWHQFLWGSHPICSKISVDLWFLTRYGYCQARTRSREDDLVTSCDLAILGHTSWPQAISPSLGIFCSIYWPTTYDILLPTHCNFHLVRFLSSRSLLNQNYLVFKPCSRVVLLFCYIAYSFEFLNTWDWFI